MGSRDIPFEFDEMSEDEAARYNARNELQRRKAAYSEGGVVSEEADMREEIERLRKQLSAVDSVLGQFGCRYMRNDYPFFCGSCLFCEVLAAIDEEFATRIRGEVEL